MENNNNPSVNLSPTERATIYRKAAAAIEKQPYLHKGSSVKQEPSFGFCHCSNSAIGSVFKGNNPSFDHVSGVAVLVGVGVWVGVGDWVGVEVGARFYNKQEYKNYPEDQKIFKKLTGLNSIISWNDKKETTQEEVVSVLNKWADEVEKLSE